MIFTIFNRGIHQFGILWFLRGSEDEGRIGRSILGLVFRYCCETLSALYFSAQPKTQTYLQSHLNRTRLSVQWQAISIRSDTASIRGGGVKLEELTVPVALSWSSDELIVK